LQDFLQNHFTNTVQAPAGHSYARLATFLSDGPYGHMGTSEQFATAFAVLGRTLGLPTRVAVGFLPSATGPGTHEVTNEDVVAWPEVWFETAGWVAFDPTPAESPTSMPVTEQTNSASGIASEMAQNPALTPSPVLSSTSGKPLPHEGRDSWGVIFGFALAGIALLLVLAGVLVVAAKRRRRAGRRYAGSAAARILGAWSEALDRLTQQGLPPTESLTAAEVVRAAQLHVGSAGDPVAPLGDLLNLALYAPTMPEPSQGDAAWRSVDDLMAGLASSTSRIQRARELLDPRPLLHR
jgi:hypothetical protein